MLMDSRISQISRLCAVRMGYSFRQKPVYIENGNTRIIQPKDVTADGILKTDSLDRIDFPAGTNLSRGDVLLINRGRFSACVFEDDQKIPCVATSAFLILTPKHPDRLLPDYLALFFNSIEGQNILKRFNETTTVPFISRGNIESVSISVPPPDIQRELAALERTKQRFIQLTTRKIELINNLINSELTTVN